MKKSFMIAALLLSTTALAQGPATWVGNFQSQIARQIYQADCASDVNPVTDGTIQFESWARQRAAVTALCFEVYQEGVTESFRNDIPSHLNVRVYETTSGAPSGSGQAAQLVGRRGNNAVYAFDLRTLDPYGCPMNCSASSAQLGDEVSRRLSIFVQNQEETGATMSGQSVKVVYSMH